MTEETKTPRRQRMVPQSTGKRVIPTERDLIWLQKLHEHGPLSSVYLHAFTKHKWKSGKTATERFTDLYNESNTPHKGTYFSCPKQQAKTQDARNNPLVFDVGKAGERLLKEKELWQEYRREVSSPWWHGYMVSCVTASIDLATLDRDDVSYIPGSQILERTQAKIRHPVSIIWPGKEKPLPKDLIPDALFGLEYQQHGEKRYRFFAVEADRSTEPAKTTDHTRKSLERHVLQYRQYVGAGIYKEHLNLTAPMLVLNVASSAERLKQMTELISDMAGPNGNNYQLLQTIDGFGDILKPPAIQCNFLQDDWQRVGMEPFRIDTA